MSRAYSCTLFSVAILICFDLDSVLAWFTTSATLVTRQTSTLHATTAGFGSSDGKDTASAVAEAVSLASIQNDMAKPSVAFVSTTVSRDIEEVRKCFAEELPGTPIHGITSSGSILTNEGSKAGAVGCLLVSAEDGSFATAYDKNDGLKATAALKEKMPNPQAIFMGATPGAEEEVIEFLSVKFPGVPVFGGTAADDELNGSWSVFSDDSSSATGVSLVGVSDSVSFGASMLGPYTPTEATFTATKTDGRRVFEVDGEPAADWAYNWIGDECKEQYEKGGLVLPLTAQKPIGITSSRRKGLGRRIRSLFPGGKPEEEPEYVTGHLAGFGGAEKFIDFFAPVEEGSTLTIMDSGSGPSTGYETALSNAVDTAKSSLEGSDPKAALLVYCGGMAIAVGEKLDKGLKSASFTSKMKGVPMMGMTCFGEQACLPKSKKNVQRNLSVGCIVFG